MEFSIDNVKKAYLHLKSYAYHENLNLFLKQRVSEFEASESDDSFSEILDALNEGDESAKLKEWVSNICYHVLPKVVERKEDKIQNEHNRDNGLFITNVRDSDQYQVIKVNYFINAPVELHIIEMLWCLYAGTALDAALSKDTYGNRLHKSAAAYAKNAEHTTGPQL